MNRLSEMMTKLSERNNGCLEIS